MSHYLLIDSGLGGESENSPVKFSNRFLPTIELDFHKRYEMALVELFSTYSTFEGSALHLVQCNLLSSQNIGNGRKQLLRAVVLPNSHATIFPLIYVPMLPISSLQHIQIFMSPFGSDQLPRWFNPPARLQMLIHIREIK